MFRSGFGIIEMMVGITLLCTMCGEKQGTVINPRGAAETNAKSHIHRGGDYHCQTLPTL